MLPVWAGWESPIRWEVYSAPTRKLHQLTNMLITYHLSQYPNQTLGLVPSCAFSDFKVTRTKKLGWNLWNFEFIKQTKKKCHHVVCILLISHDVLSHWSLQFISCLSSSPTWLHIIFTWEDFLKVAMLHQVSDLSSSFLQIPEAVLKNCSDLML